VLRGIHHDLPHVEAVAAERRASAERAVDEVDALRVVRARFSRT
jgi:hypothetical protein